MKIAIISDIHANIHALEAVWEDLKKQRPDKVYCLGDLVGYGAYPNEVVTFIRERAIPTVMGNYDEGVGYEYLYEDRPDATFERIAKLAGTKVVLFGHTHLPYQKRVANTLFINTGSVGKPKDGDPRAGYVTLELKRRPRAEFRRVPYDVESAARAILESDLPDYFAERLRTGDLPIVPHPVPEEVLR